MAHERDSLCDRAQRAILRNQSLRRERECILEMLTDIAAQRWIVAQDTGRWVEKAERRLVSANSEAIRAGRHP